MNVLVVGGGIAELTKELRGMDILAGPREQISPLIFY